MANADTTADILRHAGYEEITPHRPDEPITIGTDLEAAIEPNDGPRPS